MTKPILVLDDPENSMTEVVQALVARGYGPVVIHGDANVVAEAEKTRAEIIFLSLRNPQAQVACEAVRDSPEGAITPIIFIGTGAEAITSVGSPGTELEFAL